ncbi:IS110 family transposase [Rhodococcus sp. MS16]|nr:IS110 family transposase [Rhodococcus sp. MS16]
MAVARYLDRHSMARKKFDHMDAMTLVTSCESTPRMRSLPLDSDLMRTITVLPRAAQNAIWRRTKATQELRALPREYCPGFLSDSPAPVIQTSPWRTPARYPLSHRHLHRVRD